MSAHGARPGLPRRQTDVELSNEFTPPPYLSEEQVIDAGPEAWKLAASCRGIDPEIFYPPREEDTGVAKSICANCVVREQCLNFALVHNEKDGVWGGQSENERRRSSRRRRIRN